MNTPIIENLLPRLRETVATQMKNYLGGEGELSGIYDSLEFWWDGIRDREFPELPMWSDLSTPDKDRLFDEWIEAVEGFFASRGKPVGPSNASGAGAPSAGTDVPSTLPWVDSTCCPTCGCVGAHFCTGGQPSHSGWSAADQSLPVSVAPAASLTCVDGDGTPQEHNPPMAEVYARFQKWWEFYSFDCSPGSKEHMKRAFWAGYCEAHNQSHSLPDASAAPPLSGATGEVKASPGASVCEVDGSANH